MTKSEYKKLSNNSEFINAVGNGELNTNVKENMENNLKSALIGGGVGVLIAIATRRNLVLYGISGLIVGRFLLNIK
jgi:hypothetical protein